MEKLSLYLKVRAKGRSDSIFEIPMDSVDGNRVTIKRDDGYEVIAFLARSGSEKQEKQAG